MLKLSIKASARWVAAKANTLLGLLGIEIIRKTKTSQKSQPAHSFCFDGIETIHDSSFMEEKDFLDAYDHAKALIGKDYHWYWRNYIGVKLADYAFSISPNFVECGVGEGWMTISILRYLYRKHSAIPAFTLFDTFSGIDPDVVDPREEACWGVTGQEMRKYYQSIYNANVEMIKERIFATLGNKAKTDIVQGAIPVTLTASVIEKIKKQGAISFLHIDMNNSVPEIAALQTFYPLVAAGGVILLDDYAYAGYTFQKNAIDNACREMAISTPISLPSGQGLLLKAK